MTRLSDKSWIWGGRTLPDHGGLPSVIGEVVRHDDGDQVGIPVELTFDTIANQSYTVGSAFTLTPVVHNPKNYPTTFSIVGPTPPGMSINSTTGVITGPSTSAETDTLRILATYILGVQIKKKASNLFTLTGISPEFMAAGSSFGSPLVTLDSFPLTQPIADSNRSWGWAGKFNPSAMTWTDAWIMFEGTGGDPVDKFKAEAIVPAPDGSFVALVTRWSGHTGTTLNIYDKGHQVAPVTTFDWRVTSLGGAEADTLPALLKYDASGTFQWARSFVGNNTNGSFHFPANRAIRLPNGNFFFLTCGYLGAGDTIGYADGTSTATIYTHARLTPGVTLGIEINFATGAIVNQYENSMDPSAAIGGSAYVYGQGLSALGPSGEHYEGGSCELNDSRTATATFHRGLADAFTSPTFGQSGGGGGGIFDKLWLNKINPDGTIAWSAVTSIHPSPNDNVPHGALQTLFVIVDASGNSYEGGSGYQEIGVFGSPMNGTIVAESAGWGGTSKSLPVCLTGIHRATTFLTKRNSAGTVQWMIGTDNPSTNVSNADSDSNPCVWSDGVVGANGDIFIAGENCGGVIGFADGGGTQLPIASAQGDGATTTLALTLASGVADHNLRVNERVFINNNGSGAFSGGFKTITARTATTISYAEVVAAFGPITPGGSATFVIDASANPEQKYFLIRVRTSDGVILDHRLVTHNAPIQLGAETVTGIGKVGHRLLALQSGDIVWTLEAMFNANATVVFSDNVGDAVTFLGAPTNALSGFAILVSAICVYGGDLSLKHVRRMDVENGLSAVRVQSAIANIPAV